MTDSDTQPTASASVGQKLKALRESSNIGTLEVASQLHLDSRIINAIEDDDYGSLPDSIYVRGYIRSYSRLVGGDANEMVRLFEENVGIQEPEIIPEIKYPSQSSSSDKPVKAFTYLIILGLVILVIAWWQSNYIVDLKTPAEEAIDISANIGSGTPLAPQLQPAPVNTYSTQAAPSAIPLELLDIDEFTTGSLNTAEDAVTEIENSPETDESIQTSDPVLDEAAITAENQSEITETDSTPNTTADAAVPETDTDLTSVQPDIGQTQGPDTLVFNLTADSWIEITDVNNQRLFMDLARTGTTLNLRGTAPFDILLGFAQGVTLEYNGEPFDIAPYSRAGVAKFSLGE